MPATPDPYMIAKVPCGRCGGVTHRVSDCAIGNWETKLDDAIAQDFGRWSARMGEARWYQSQCNTYAAGFMAGGAWSLRTSAQLAGLAALLRDLVTLLEPDR